MDNISVYISNQYRNLQHQTTYNTLIINQLKFNYTQLTMIVNSLYHTKERIWAGFPEGKPEVFLEGFILRDKPRACPREILIWHCLALSQTMLIKGKELGGTGISSGWQGSPWKSQYLPPIFLSLIHYQPIYISIYQCIIIQKYNPMMLLNEIFQCQVSLHD